MKNGNAVELALKLMRRHGLSRWKVALNGSRSNHGEVDFNSHTLFLSRFLTVQGTFWEVRDTVLHEIAHIKRGNHYHDKKWREIAERIGALPLRVAAKKKKHGQSKRHT